MSENKIKLNKIYIGGLNMSGKNLVLNLLNSHPYVISYPFHKFGISHEIEEFIDKFKKRSQSYNYTINKNDFSFFKIQYVENENFLIAVEDLIVYLFRLDNSMPNLLGASQKKRFTFNVTDSQLESIDLDFKLEIFINELYKKQSQYATSYINLEDLENLIFVSFIKSVDQFNKIDLSKIIFASYLYNGSKHYLNIAKYYKDFKIILVKRNLLNRCYSKAKRSYRGSSIKDKKMFFSKLIYDIHFQKKVDNDVYNKSLNEHRNNKSIQVVEFSDLISNLEKKMKDLSYFLEIDFNKEMLKPSIINSYLNYYKENEITEGDKIENFLDKQDLKRINFLIKYNLFRYMFVTILRIRSRLSFSIGS